MVKKIAGWLLVIIAVFFFVPAVMAPGPSASDDRAYHWPIDPPVQITSTLGEYRGEHFHNGIDFSTRGRTGRWVRAIERGQVVEVFYDPEAYGITVVLEHEDGWRSWYSHLERIAASILEKLNTPLYEHVRIIPAEEIWVSRGRRIGVAGETGRGPVHLHFALQKRSGEFVNPIGLFEEPLPFNPNPYLDELHVYPLDGESWVNGTAKPVVLDSRENQPLELWGKIGIDAILWNIHPGTENRSMPEKLMLLRNGELKFELDFSVLEPQLQKLPQTAVFNLNQTNLSPTQYGVKLSPFVEENSFQPLDFSEPGEEGQLELVMTGGGNSPEDTIKTFDYRVIEPPSTNFSSNQASSVSANPNAELEMRLNYRWYYNRVRIELQVDGDYSGKPQVSVRGDDFYREIQLQPQGGGGFVGWWQPSFARDGWHTIQATINGEKGNHSSVRRVYLQSLQNGQPGAVASPDGRYTIFSGGGGHSFDCFVWFENVYDRYQPRRGLELVDPPRVIHPGYFQSLEPLIVNATIDEKIKNPETVGIYGWNELQERWQVLSYKESLNPRIRELELYNFPVLALMKDNLPPRIKDVAVIDAKKLIRIVFEEKESGLTADGIKISSDTGNPRYFWNRDRQWLEIPFSEFADDKSVSLEVELTDRAGLTANWHGEVSLN